MSALSSRQVYLGGSLARGVWPLLIGFVLPEGLSSHEVETPVGASVIAARIPEAETGQESDHLTGDWNGFRTRLVETGFHFQAGYSGEVFANVAGGKKRGAVYEGLLELGLDVDPSRFSSWQGLKLHVSGLYPHGESPSGELVGDLATVSSLDAYDAFSLFEWWMDQGLAQDRLSLRLGQLAADEEFAASDHAGALLNATFGWPSFIALNTPAPAFPVAALGFRARWQVQDEFYAQLGVFDGNPDPGSARGRPVNRHGTHLTLSEEEGAWVMLETGLEVEWGERERPLRGTYKLGGWYHTAEFDHLREDRQGRSLADPLSDGIPASLTGNWGVYVVADQMVWEEENSHEAATQGLGVFARMGGSPSDRSFISFNIDAGLQYAGLCPGRDQDVAGVGVSWLQVSDEAAKLSGEQGLTRYDYEMVWEATYRISLQSWWFLQPDVQYVIHPGGSTMIKNALVIGLRSSITF